MYPHKLNLKIIRSTRIEEASPPSSIKSVDPGNYHLFLNLGANCQAKASFAKSDLSIGKNVLLCWGPCDEVDISTPVEKSYIHIVYKMMDGETQKPLKEWLSINENKDPRVYLTNQLEIMQEFLHLPNARQKGKYHIAISTLRLGKIIALLGQDHWVPDDRSEAFSKESLLPRDPKSRSSEHDDEMGLYIRAINFICDNYNTCTTENLAEYIDTSKTKTVGLIKRLSGKLPKELIEETRLSMATRNIKKLANNDRKQSVERSSAALVEESARMVGYKARTLANKFKKRHGITPFEHYLDLKNRQKKE